MLLGRLWPPIFGGYSYWYVFGQSLDGVHATLIAIHCIALTHKKVYLPVAIVVLWEDGRVRASKDGTDRCLSLARDTQYGALC